MTQEKKVTVEVTKEYRDIEKSLVFHVGETHDVTEKRAEALVKAGYDLYYYKKENSTLEEDFFVRTAEALVPVEVKASNNRSKSLRTLIDSEHYPDIHFGIKLAGTNIGYGNGVYTFPYFCSFLLKEYLRGFQHLENKS